MEGVMVGYYEGDGIGDERVSVTAGSRKRERSD